MSATTSQGTGHGVAVKPTINELATLVNTGPNILFTGIVASGGVSSPPVETGVVVFPYALTGAANQYVILLTTLNGGKAYVSDVSETESGFLGFTCIAESECDVMYMVATIGARPLI
jgi:hypothetical protein